MGSGIRHQVNDALRRRMPVFYDDKAAIGGATGDRTAAGTPFGITVDGQTLRTRP